MLTFIGRYKNYIVTEYILYFATEFQLGQFSQLLDGKVTTNFFFRGLDT